MNKFNYMRNRKWLNDHKLSHPFACHTSKSHPRPTIVRIMIPRLHFASAPLINHTEWRFETAEDRALFMTVFVATIIKDNPQEKSL